MSLFEGLGNAIGLGTQGASNNMYGTAQNMTASQYNQMMQQQQMAMAQQGAYNQAAVQSYRVFDPNKEEAYIIPLSQLVTLWQAKYGDTWANENEFLFGDCDKFFGPAYERLKANMKFERMAGWVRLREDA